MIDDAIDRVEKGQGLSRSISREVFDEIMSGKVETGKIASLLKALAGKGESVDEIAGAAESMRAVVSRVRPRVGGLLLDVVGTGGDKKHTINISTIAAIVAAGAGCLVAKHGNRSASSKCGAADVLEKLGVNIECDSEKNAELIENIGIAFLFAQKHHPAMKYAMPARKQLGIRTIFNILGPITNPANAQTYLLGVADLGLAEKLAGVLVGLGTEHALVVHGNDGCDEVSIGDATAVFEVENGKVKRYEISPEQFGFERALPEFIVAETVEDAADAMKAILEGKEEGAKRDVVVLNAGTAIYANNRAGSIADGVEKARESIDSGKAAEKLRQLIEGSNA